MIYIKNTTETQTVFIPRNELQKEAYITSTKTYEDGYREGLEDGKEYQKDQLLNLYVTENGQYEREDGWGTVTVDIPIGDCPECEDCSGAYDEGYEIGKNEGYEDGFQDGYDQGQADCPQGDDCPELTTIDITENGSYEGAFNLVNVNVPQDGGECNLEYKMIAPSMGDRDDNGYIVVEEGEGYNGLSRVVIDPFRIYNEGVSAGKAEGGDLNIGTGDIYLTANERGQRFEILPSEFEYDAFDKFIVEMENFDLGDDANIYLSNEFVTMFWDGKLTIGKTYIVKGQISDIQIIRPEYGDARYTLDGGFNIYNGQTMGYDLQIFDWVIVSGILSEYDGAPQFSAGSEIKALWRDGGSGNCDDAYNNGYNDGYGNGYNDGQANCEGGSCNLEDKWVTPSMTDIDDNGYVVVEESEGFDGLSRVVIDPTTIYNEGYADGYNEGSNQLSNNVLEGDMVLSFQLNDNNFPDLRNDGKGIFMWDGFKVPLYIKRPNGCGELYLSGNYDKNNAPSLQSKFFQDDDYAKIEKLTINFYHIIPNNIVNVVNLKELHLGENVEIIDKNAFQDVSNLKTIYCHFDREGIWMYATKESFVGLPNNGTLYVKKSQQPTWGWIEDLGWTIVNI